MMIQGIPPCPFCGEDETIISDLCEPSKNQFWVTCEGGCAMSGPCFPSESEAIEAWGKLYCIDEPEDTNEESYLKGQNFLARTMIAELNKYLIY